MTKEELRHRIMYDVIENIRTCKGISRYDALEKAVYNIYRFSSFSIHCGTFKTDYRKRCADFVVLGDETALSDKELELASQYYGDTPLNGRLEQKVFDIFKTTLTVHREWIAHLEEATADTRKILKGINIGKVKSRIRDYLNYCEEFIDFPGEMSRFAAIYQIGYADGKREERRKKHKATYPNEAQQ